MSGFLPSGGGGTPSGAAGGDLSGTYPDPNVSKIQGNSVSNTSPSDGYALIWSTSEGKWVPTANFGMVNHSLGGSYHTADTLSNLNTKVSDADLIATTTVAGGDLSGTYPNPTVSAIEGYGVALTQPTDGYALTWNNGLSQWESSKPIPGGTAGGDLSGTYPNPTVSAIEGYSVVPTQPTDGYALTWNNSLSQWESNKPIPGGVAGGDLSGTYPNPIVSALQGQVVSATTPADGYYLQYTSSTWVPAPMHVDSEFPKISWTDVDTITVTKARCQQTTVRVSMIDKQRYFIGSLTFKLSAGVAEGGLDTGAEAASTWYYLYLVPKAADDNLLVLRGSVNPPTTGPIGYTYWKYLCAVRNDESSNLKVFYQQTNTFFYGCQYAPYSTLWSTLGTTPVVSLTAKDISDTIPQTAEFAYFTALVGHNGSEGGEPILAVGIADLDYAFISLGAYPIWQRSFLNFLMPTPGVTKKVNYSCYNDGTNKIAVQQLSIGGWIDGYSGSLTSTY